MPAKRSLLRDIHIHDAKKRTAELGSLVVTDSFTNANFYSMVEILILGLFSLWNEGGTEIQKDRHSLQPGNYYIVATSEFLITLF